LLGFRQILNPIFSAFSSILPRGATIFDAIESGNLDEVKKIIEKYPLVLNETDEYGDTPLSLATICESGYGDKDNRLKVLQIILDHQFERHIDKGGQEVLKELLSKKMLLKGIYSGEDASFNFKCLEKAFDKITPESIFKKVYQDLFKNVDKNQPISSKKNEEMYIFQSNLEDHSSFFIFHVNKKDGKLTSISYCDGNEIDEGRKIKGSTTHINGVTTFKLKTPIEYSYENFVKNFIKDNTENKKKKSFIKNLQKKQLQSKERKLIMKKPLIQFQLELK